MHINLNQLRAFSMAARHKSITEAAKALYVSPPAITMQIKKLEQWLGFKLVCHNRSRFALTERGETLFGFAETIFTHVDTLESHVEAMLGKLATELVFGVHHIPAQYLMPGLLAHVRRTCPNLHIDLQLGTQREFLEKIRNRTMDAALVVGEVREPGIQLRPLITEELVLVTAPTSGLADGPAISIAELNRVPLILQQKGTGILTGVQNYLDRHGITPRIVLENMSSDIIKHLLASERCASFIVRFAIRKDLEDGALREIPITEGGPTVQMNLAFPADRNPPRNLQLFLGALSTYRFPQRDVPFEA